MCVKCLLWKLNFQFVHFMAECFRPSLSYTSLSVYFSVLLSLLLLLLYENHKQEHEAIQNDVDKDCEM